MEAFVNIKERLINAPILVPPNWFKAFHIHADASQTTVGAVLCQANDKKVDHPIFYASHNLSDLEQNYTTRRKSAYLWFFLWISLGTIC